MSGMGLPEPSGWAEVIREVHSSHRQADRFGGRGL
jgi:hypothetical protein